MADDLENYLNDYPPTEKEANFNICKEMYYQIIYSTPILPIRSQHKIERNTNNWENRYNNRKKWLKTHPLPKKNLPIIKHKDEIVNGIKNNRVLIISGDTGCGKSTQVPQMILDDDTFGPNSYVICCQVKLFLLYSHVDYVQQHLLKELQKKEMKDQVKQFLFQLDLNQMYLLILNLNMLQLVY